LTSEGATISQSAGRRNEYQEKKDWGEEYKDPKPPMALEMSNTISGKDVTEVPLGGKNANSSIICSAMKKGQSRRGNVFLMWSSVNPLAPEECLLNKPEAGLE